MVEAIPDLPDDRFLNKRSLWIIEDIPYRKDKLEQSKNELAAAMHWSPLAEIDKVTNPEIALLVRRRNLATKKGRGSDLSLDQEQALNLFIQTREDYRKSQQVKQRREKQNLLTDTVVLTNQPTEVLPVLEPVSASLTERHPLRARLGQLWNTTLNRAAYASKKQVLAAGVLGAGLLLGAYALATRQEVAAPPSAEPFIDPLAKISQSPLELIPTEPVIQSPAAALNAENQSQDKILVTATPDRYYQAIINAAEANHIPPRLLSALLWQESRFNPKAQSSEGSKGLAQFEDGTAAVYKLNPWNDFDSIQASAQYLAYLYKRYNNWPKAIAAYNAGPTTIDKYGGIPPYPKTKNYVRSILNNWNNIDTTESK